MYASVHGALRVGRVSSFDVYSTVDLYVRCIGILCSGGKVNGIGSCDFLKDSCEFPTEQINCAKSF